MGKYINPHHKITSWVAFVIIAAIGSTCVYFIWVSANDSWGFDYVYPSFNAKVTKFLTNFETVGWLTHQDLGYGFEVRVPSKYSKTIDIVSQNSLLGVSGASIGPLVFVKAESPTMRKLASDTFNHYWNYLEKAESPTNYCRKQILEGADFNIKVVFCLINKKEENYAYIKGKNVDFFIDGFTSGYDKRLKDAYGMAGVTVSQTEFTQILSTFKFVAAK
jgi:hypothetical protein